MFCPTACTNYTLVGNPTGGCQVRQPRRRTPSRVGTFKCDLALPSPFTAANTAPLFAPGGGIVVSSPLFNVSWEEPTTEDQGQWDCLPNIPMITGRVLSFEDRTPITKPDDPATPGTNEEDLWHDWVFWKDKLIYQRTLRWMNIYCNGDVHLARNEDGLLMDAVLTAHIAYQRLNTNGSIEFIKGRLAFQGDPIYFRKPDFNLVDFGINV